MAALQTTTRSGWHAPAGHADAAWAALAAAPAGTFEVFFRYCVTRAEFRGRGTVGRGTPMTTDSQLPPASVDLYWIPLGAGSPVVQASGRLFEGILARRHRRPPCDLYHAALQVRTRQGCFAVEQAPVPDHDGTARGVVAVGPVGLRAAGRFRVFRYEVRCWRDGIIPDLGAAVDSPRRLSNEPGVANRVLERLPRVPTMVWGRDEARTGDMWNSNSIIAWVLAGSGGRDGCDRAAARRASPGMGGGPGRRRSRRDRSGRPAFECSQGTTFGDSVADAHRVGRGRWPWTGDVAPVRAGLLRRWHDEIVMELVPVGATLTPEGRPHRRTSPDHDESDRSRT